VALMKYLREVEAIKGEGGEELVKLYAALGL
jgi:hypothetical protein